MKQHLVLPTLALALASSAFALRPLHAATPATGADDAGKPAGKPNIIFILADDLGYADLGCQGSEEVPTPHIDTIATDGIRFTDGYVTAPQCVPSRGGLLSGRYQNRFGLETNSHDPACGLPLGEKTMGDQLRAAGYATALMGKWHLGFEDKAMRPNQRGFDETLWHPVGGVYLPAPKTGILHNVWQNNQRARIKEYSVDAYTDAGLDFIERHKDQPFFLFMSYDTPHWPMEAKPEHLKQFEHVPDLHRRTMLAMMASLDENVGRILDKLKAEGLDEKTLVVFLSDNGGPTGDPRPAPDAPFQFAKNTSKNNPLRGVKGQVLDGGNRVPFMARWTGHIPPGRVSNVPVISLDLLPTFLAAAGSPPLPDSHLDGVNILPLMTGQTKTLDREALYWRFRFPPEAPALHRWAIRQGDWKLVKDGREPLALYNIVTDIGETKNLAAEQPERVSSMQAAYKKWDAQNMDPRWK